MRNSIIVLAALALLQPAHRCQAQEKVLNPEVKASAKVTPRDATGMQTVTLDLRINKGWYIYANPVMNAKDVFKTCQTSVRVSAQQPLNSVKIQFPAGEQHEEFGDKYMIYHDQATIVVTVQRTPGDVSPLVVDLVVNTCHLTDMRCLPKGQAKFILP